MRSSEINDTPPVRSNRLTLERLTPERSATAAWVNPRSSRRALARKPMALETSAGDWIVKGNIRAIMPQYDA